MSWDNFVVELALTSQPDDPFPTYVDITQYVDTEQSQISVQSGKRTENDQAEPSTAVLVLNNSDHRFTSGNTTSPYYPYWKQARKIRISEVLGYRKFVHMTGWVEAPEISDWAEKGVDQFITVTVVDRLTRVDGSRKFISTLAEHIIYNGGSSLAAYYLLNESRTPIRDVQGNLNPLFVFQNVSAAALAAGAAPSDTYTFNGGAAAPGDDLAGLLFTPSTITTGSILGMAYAYSLATITKSGNPGDPGRPLIHAGVPLTFVCWLKLDSSYMDVQNIVLAQIADAATKAVVTQVKLYRDANTTIGPTAWTAALTDFGTGGLTSTILGPFGDVGGRVVPVGVQFSYSPNTFTMWIDSQEFTATPSGSLVDAQYLTLSNNFGPLSGAISHMQVYIGSFTRAQFLAQRDAGLTGLAGQYTGQRIRTIAQYAGVPAGELSNIEQGTSRMTKATLANQTALPQMRLAEATEQGRLRVGGDGGLIFNSRTTRYNV